MKSRLWCVGLLIVMASQTLHATTLKLAPEIDLLVLDGRKISGSLLKGAEGIELEKGQHQFLFRVEKPLGDANHTTAYISVPLIATFIAESKSVTIRLPALNTVNDTLKLDRLADFQLVNEQNQVIDSQRDKLNLVAGSDAGQAMMAYNRANRIASVPRFAVPANTAGLKSNMSGGLVHIPPPTVLYFIFGISKSTPQPASICAVYLKHSLLVECRRRGALHSLGC